MAHAVRGSEEEHRKRPIINANICTLAPLAMDSHSLECALFYARSGIPQSLMAMPCMATTAPSTVLGAVATGEAEIVALMTLLQLAVPGAPLIHCNIVGQMDPVNANSILDVAQPAGHIVVQMAREIWKLPSLGGVLGCMNPPEPGWESGLVDGQAAAMMSLAGPDIPGFIGLLDDAMTVHPEQIILSHEAVQRAYDMLCGFQFNEDDIALDVIDSVGPKNHFLMESHTLHGLRKLRHSPVLRKKDNEGNFRNPRDVAKDIYRTISEEHIPEPLSEDVLVALNRIMEGADKVGNTLN
jgi:trimethylamine--corrinoid protein Co-methyltransferase